VQADPAGVNEPSPSPSISPDDGVEGPAADAIVGDATLVHQVKPAGTGSKKTGGGTKGSGTKGSGTKGSGTNSRSTPPGRRDSGSKPATVPRSVQEVLVKGAQYISTILPKGFRFLICPVQGHYAYSDDYGAPRYAGGYHPHAGNDIFADFNTPVVARSTGTWRRSRTRWGATGEGARALGYVSMAHLIAYGPGVPGNVKAGQVVGFVGNTGDAQGTSPHDHFEWHPNAIQAYDRSFSGANGAVDPFQYLRVVCPPG
jgi:murein DD-endopeptidase MepM/ murein hydrolase activator NlpD